MFSIFKKGLLIALCLGAPIWVFHNTGSDITIDKLIYLWENKHTLDWYGFIFERHLFGLVCTFSLMLNLLIMNYAVPIMSFVKNTR